MSTDKNRYKGRSTKGYYGIMKGVVTRNILHKPKPDLQDWMTSSLEEFFPELAKKFTENSPLSDLKKSLLDGVSENKWDVQVWIPAYHGGLNPDPTMIGTRYDVGEYPWAQVCGPIFKDNIGYDNLDNEDKKYIKERFGFKDGDESYPEVWSELFVGHPFMEDVPSTYPGIGDTVFLAFEGGDINRPIVIGSLACDANKVIYSGKALNGDDVTTNNAMENMAEYQLLETVDAITINSDTGVKFPLPKAYPISCDFGWAYSNGTFHNGIDYAAPQGTPLVAAFAGMVSDKYHKGGFGTHIYLSGTVSGVGITAIYGHMSTISKTGRVEAGDVVGTVGSTGNSSGPHLHFSLKLDNMAFKYKCIGQSKYYPNGDGGTHYSSGYVHYVDPTGFLTNGAITVPAGTRDSNGTIVVDLPDKRKR